MNDQTYHGWTNWDTWNLNLHLTSYEYFYQKLRIFKNKEQLEVFCIDNFKQGFDGIDLNNVNYQEILESNEE